jgi:glycerol-3-phosphate acyltransferase PlsY
LIGKINKIDIRDHGSGNIGATNVLRTLGKKWGYFCFLCDFSKGCLPVLIFSKLAVTNMNFVVGSNEMHILAVITVLSTVMGHVLSVFMKFKGGKGIATSAGAIIALHPLGLLAALIIWIIFFKKTGYVSLASILASLVLPFSAVGENIYHKQPAMSPIIYMLIFIAVMVTVKHRTNIKRLMDGTESSFKKKKVADENSSS